jgi:hypothetical protein
MVAAWGLGGCAADSASAPSRAVEGPGAGPATRPATQPDLPVLVHWHDGNYHLRSKPFVLFAAWADGRVVRLLPFGPHYAGNVPPDRIEAMMEQAAKARLFDPPLRHGHVVPDGHSETLVAHHAGKSIRLSHDGKFEWRNFDRTPPSPDQEAFVNTWVKVHSAMNDVWPDRLERVKPGSPLTQPAR